MRIEKAYKVEAFTIYDAQGLDPVFVCLHDLGPGSGRVVIDCYGWAFSGYWGAIGDMPVREFLKSCGVDYIVNKLHNPQRPPKKNEVAYLTRVVKALKQSLGEGESR